jgi:hypothetical protein
MIFPNERLEIAERIETIDGVFLAIHDYNIL